MSNLHESLLGIRVGEIDASVSDAPRLLDKTSGDVGVNLNNRKYGYEQAISNLSLTRKSRCSNAAILTVHYEISFRA